MNARICFNRSTQRGYIGKEDTASPTVAAKRVLLTATLNSKQATDIMIADMPNAFVQVDISYANQKERIIMKIKGLFVEVLCGMAP